MKRGMIMANEKTWEDMTKQELEQELKRLQSLVFDTEWQNEFNRQEIEELSKLIKEKFGENC
jgi:hypothetical protein